MAQRGAAPQAGVAAAAAPQSFDVTGVYTETKEIAWSGKVLYNWKVAGDWYGVGDREPDGIYEGDTISFTFKNGKMKDDGTFYKNMIAKTVKVSAAGEVPAVATAQAAAASVGGSVGYIAPATAVSPDARQKNIVMQSSMRTAGQLIGAAIQSGNLTLPANAKSGKKKDAGFDAMVLAFEKLTDSIYLKAMNIDGYITQDEGIIDSIDDADMGDFDDDLPQ